MVETSALNVWDLLAKPRDATGDLFRRIFDALASRWSLSFRDAGTRGAFTVYNMAEQTVKDSYRELLVTRPSGRRTTPRRRSRPRCSTSTRPPRRPAGLPSRRPSSATSPSRRGSAPSRRTADSPTCGRLSPERRLPWPMSQPAGSASTRRSDSRPYGPSFQSALRTLASRRDGLAGLSRRHDDEFEAAMGLAKRRLDALGRLGAGEDEPGIARALR
jgi:hypothetical protein